MSKKALIVGGVASGASAAARLRRLKEDLDIVIFEKGEHISFANCGLPYYIGEVIKTRESLLLQTPEKMKDRFNIDVRVNSEVVFVDTNEKKVKVKSFDKEYEEKYDYLILAPGARPIKPNLPGIDSNKVFTVRNVKDVDRIKEYSTNSNMKSAVVIGGGFIGIEMAENLRHKGLDVTIVEATPHLLSNFDDEFSILIEKELNDNKVSIILNKKVVAFKDEDATVKVVLEDNREVETDIVISAIGVSPDTSFIRDSGISLGERGHILVNEKMETSVEGVYAAGDAVLVKDIVSGKEAYIPLAGPANKQGRIIADNISGNEAKYKGSLGTAIIKIFDMVAAATGNNEKALKRNNVNYKKVYLHPLSHAGYYPDATNLNIKVLYDTENGKLLGAQVLGYEGVDKFIDVIATTIKFGGTMEDLKDLDLAYAPPFLSAKSPANMAGFIAENEAKELVDIINIEDLENLDLDKQILLDTRDESEVALGSIENSINIPVNELRNNLDKLDKNKEIIVYCAVGIRGYIAVRILKAYGYRAKNLNGGYKSYVNWKYEAKDLNNSISNRSEDLAMKEVALDKIRELNATGLSCPGPLMQVKQMMDMMEDGEILKVRASDEGFYRDIEAWTKITNNKLLDIEKNKGIIEATILKGSGEGNSTGNRNSETTDKALASTTSNTIVENNNGQTMVVFSGDLDKAIASFIIANGAATMGKKVTMFFTFWGLNILRKPEKVNTPKNIIEKAFGMMMPRGSKKLGLSRMNMGGMGAKMIRGVMKNKNIQSLEDLMTAAIENGIEIVACTMSMDVMGIKKEELIDGITYGGVGYYLGEANSSNVNLFI
ncbi:pyridine nucleotide-disulfide oxidoreductase [Clostridium sartagoforme]|uniref:Pyridine nucleotide-disulfide oxidoreductase n=1 Tax=Clostridium sartagoforme TaxID=84031 RepID=A0A4V3RKX2_9CLOT|nr:FAD-dependent oxidoreductase [Clostridium sartagoforme]TGY41520.1 pyridine nucleotide-disulfide oxidoreductase [Clostridium sartagoforme]